MADPQETVWHKTMRPPPYMAGIQHETPPWHRPVQTRRAELSEYERQREQGAPRHPELEQRLFERRQRQVQHHLRQHETSLPDSAQAT